MSVRRLIVEVELDGLCVRDFCRDHGVSTWFFYELRRRHALEGDAALEPRSRAPKRVANRTPDEIRDLVVRTRKDLQDLGLDAGAGSIRSRLHAQAHEAVPSEATIWRILRDRGFITPDPAKAPKHAHRAFTAERANECWQIDATKWTLADGSWVEIINIVDDCTRLGVASTAVSSCTTTSTWASLCAGAQHWGLPARVLTDNAPAFKGSVHGNGGIEPALGALGIGIGHSRPYHPQTCGKVERFHQTLKRFLVAQPAADTLVELQDQLDQFVELYNHQRPHRAINRATPATVFAATAKDGPADHPLGEPTRIHHATVNAKGYFNVGYDIQIGLGRAHAGQPVTTVITGTRAHVFIHGQLARALSIDPTCKYQRQTNP